MKLNIIIALTIATFPIYNNAMQETRVLKQIWVVPIFGAYKPIECPTYITDTIYFEGKADLVGGSHITDNTLCYKQ
jgi:hypothetical protein